MNQLIKLDNKISNHKNGQISLKITFQSSIMKYVERKKKEFSSFSNLNQKLNGFEDKNIPIDSNLINKNTKTNFHQSRKQTQPKIAQQVNFEIDDRKTPSSFINKKPKGHKSSLSDWRNLYGQKEEIIVNQYRMTILQDKKAFTDRFFSPAKKMTIPDFQNEQIKRASCLHKIQLQRKSQEKFKKVSDIQRQNSNMLRQKGFLSDQNFYHLFYRTNTPSLGDELQNMRIVKYLKENKHKRKTSQGFRLINEVFSNQQAESEKDSKCFRKTSMLQDNSEKQFISKKLSEKRRTKMNEKSRKKLDIIRPNRSKLHQNDQTYINPQIYQVQNEPQTIDRRMKNLSKILSFDLKMQQNKEITLKLFRPRKNIVQKAISCNKSTISQQNLCKGKNVAKKYSVRKTSINWKTFY